jgi:hypothetical protein
MEGKVCWVPHMPNQFHLPQLPLLIDQSNYYYMLSALQGNWYNNNSQLFPTQHSFDPRQIPDCLPNYIQHSTFKSYRVTNEMIIG